jgi:hypothetical protein
MYPHIHSDNILKVRELEKLVKNDISLMMPHTRKKLELQGILFNLEALSAAKTLNHPQALSLLA